MEDYKTNPIKIDIETSSVFNNLQLYKHRLLTYITTLIQLSHVFHVTNDQRPALKISYIHTHIHIYTYIQAHTLIH